MSEARSHALDADPSSSAGRVPPSDLGAEKAVLSALLLDVRAFDEVLAEVRGDDFYHPAHQTLFSAMCAVHEASRPVDLITLAEQLTLQKQLDAVGGPVALAEIADFAATAANVVHHARTIRRHAINREIVAAARRISEEPGNTRAHAQVAELRERLAALDAPSERLASIGIYGDRLATLRSRPATRSPLPGFLDSESSLHVLVGRPKSGKTTFALALGHAWASGASPWPGAPALPGTRALVISREQTATRVDSVLRRLHDHDASGLVIVARDRDLTAAERTMLTLDDRGLAMLRAVLRAAHEAGKPFGFVVLDSLSRLKPPSVEENDADGMTEWLDALAEIASSFGVYLLLIHHAGHSQERTEARSAGRGSSSIAAVAQVALLLERVPGEPQQRRLRVDGNDVLSSEHFFEVADESDSPGSIRFWRRVEPGAPRIAQVLAPGEASSLTEIAWRLSGRTRVPNTKPAGDALRAASVAVSAWRHAGLATIEDGPRKSLIVRRVASVPPCPDRASAGGHGHESASVPTVPLKGHTVAGTDEGALGDSTMLSREERIVAFLAEIEAARGESCDEGALA